MRKLTLFATFFVICSISSRGQNLLRLPELEQVTTPQCKVFAKWVPSPEFLASNPRFLATGEYAVNPYSFERRKRQNEAQALGYSIDKFSSATFPAFLTESNEKVTISATVHFGFDDCHIPIPGGKSIIANYNAGTDFTTYKDEPVSIEEFKAANDFVRWTLTDLGHRKVNGPFVCADINHSLLMDSIGSLKDLFFQFEHVQTVSTTKAFSDYKLFVLTLPGYFTPLPYYFGFSALIRRHPSEPVIPSYSLYKLHVKDASGKKLKTYSQAIFIEERHRLRKAALYLHILFRQTVSVAIGSLVNQFLNDETLFKQIRQHDRSMDSLFVANPDLVPLARLQLRYSSMLNQKKVVYEKMQAIEQKLNSMGAPMDASAISANYHPTYNNHISSQTNANIDMAGQTALMLISTISNASKKAKINKAQSEFRKLGGQLDVLARSEQQLKNEFGNYIRNKNDLDRFFASSEDLDKQLASLSNSVKEQANASSQEITSANSSLSSWYNSSVTSFNSSLTANEANAGNNAGGEVGGGSSPDANGQETPERKQCAEQAKTEAENSPQVRITKKLNVTNGDSRYFEAAQWKTFECMLRVCGPYLTNQEKAAIQQVMAECKARIDANGGTGDLKVGLN